MNNKIFHIIKKYFLNTIKDYIYKIVFFFPYIWIIVFFLLPCLTILKISFSKQTEDTIPPYTSLLHISNEALNIVLNFKNYFYVIKEFLYFKIYLNSIKLAIITTIISLLISYPLALAISKIKIKLQYFFLLLIFLPSWTSLLVRIYALMRSMDQNSIFNSFLLWLKIIDKPINILYTDTAIYIGMVYCYFPFVMLPIYNSIVNLNPLLIEAASDLGAKPLKIFLKIIFPLTKNGIIIGSILIFISSFGEYIIPELLGGSENIMIGRIIWQEFFNNHDWPTAAALSVITIFLVMIPIIYLHQYQKKCN